MRSILPALACLLFSSMLQAAGVTVSDSWARETPPGARTAAVYLVLDNPGANNALLRLESDAAGQVQIHTHIQTDGMMKMQQLQRLDLPADSQTILEPGGHHLMLIDLESPLVAGSSLALELWFDDGQELVIEVPVIDGRGRR